MQEILGRGEGDCLSACLASLLEIEIGEVPKFRRDHGPEKMMPATRRWLAENHGFSLLRVCLKTLRIDRLESAPGQLCIAGGRSPEPGGLYHAVVGRIGSDGFEMVHDPHPEGLGILGEPLALYFLVPVDPVAGPRSHESQKSQVESFECPRSF